MDYKRVNKTELVYPELSYQIVGVLFEAFNKLGVGYNEKYYQKATYEIFESLKIPCKREVKITVDLGQKKKIVCFLDLVVDDKIILEFKKGDRFLKNNIDQLYGYLKSTGMKLGILVNFTKNGVQFKRIVNTH